MDCGGPCGFSGSPGDVGIVADIVTPAGKDQEPLSSLEVYLEGLSRSFEAQVSLISNAIGLSPDFAGLGREAADSAIVRFLSSVDKLRSDLRNAALTTESAAGDSTDISVLPPEVEASPSKVKEVFMADGDDEASPGNLRSGLRALRRSYTDHTDSTMHHTYSSFGQLLHRARRFLRSPIAELFTAMIVLLSVFFIALECQYTGSILDLGNGVKSNADREADWPLAHDEMFAMLNGVSLTFGIIFSLELFIKIICFNIFFFTDPINLLDTLVVVSWILTSALSLPYNTQLGRLLRLGRVLRLFKLMKHLTATNSLILMTTALQGSFMVLFWAIILLLMLHTLFALILNQVLLPYLLDTDINFYKRQQVFMYFGTFTRSMISMFEITLANWPPICRTIMENVGQWWGFFFIAHKLVVGFAVVGIINAVFMQETFQAASSDDTIMVMTKDRAARTHVKKMRSFFEDADNGDGNLTRKEFIQIVEQEEVRSWFAAQGLDVRDAGTLFKLLDEDGGGVVTLSELINGAARLKGSARHLDLEVLLQEMKELRQYLEKGSREDFTV